MTAAGGKRKPGKARAKKRPARKPAPPRTAAQEPQATPPVALPAAKPSNSLATATLVAGVAGLTFFPVIGGLIAVVVGTFALVRQREQPEVYGGRPLALAGMGLGMFGGVIPLLVLTFIAADTITPVPFVLSVTFAVVTSMVALRGRTTGQKAAIIGGSIVVTVAAVALTILLALAFYYGARALFTEIIGQIGDAFGEMFSSIGDSFSGCSDVFN